jgi:hypothetical protein
VRKLEEFVRGGGIVIATRRLPEIVPGLKATDADQSELHEIVRRLFAGPSAKAHFIEDEKQTFAHKLVSLLQPDMSLNASVPEIGFVHRRTPDADIYFVANTGNVRQTVEAAFRVPRARPEVWDPFSGNVRAARVDAVSDAWTTIALDLEPYASRLVVFTKRTLSAAAANAPTSAVQNPIDVSRGWQVYFGANSKPVVMDQLHSWTDDEATRYFSGTASYEKTVSIPREFLARGLGVQLDFGDGKALPEQLLRSGMQTWLDAPVREAALVYINGQRAGSVWCPPYALDVTKFVRPGENSFKIVVANLALNYMAGRRLPDYRLLNLRYGERFQAQDLDRVQPIQSGLLGPIRLLAAGR